MTEDPVAVRDRWIMHFSHLDNLPSILDHDGLACDQHAQGTLLKAEVGDLAIKAGRRTRVVPVGPGGTVGDYVPFYFAPRSPMMYRIACDCRDAFPGRYQGGDRPLVFFCTTVGDVVDAQLSWVTTDGNAASDISRFTISLEETDQRVDWPLMFADIWKNVPDDPDRQRRRMAELLVHARVPLSNIRALAAYDDRYARKVRNALGDHPLAQRVIVRTHWYYGYERR